MHVCDKLRDAMAVFDGGPLCVCVCEYGFVHVYFYTSKCPHNDSNLRKILQCEDEG